MDIDIIKGNFAPEEKILWQGKTQPFAVKSGAYAKPITTRFIACAAAAVVLLLAYILACNASGTNVGIVGILVCIIVPGYVAVDPFFNRRRMLKHNNYVVTDSRVYAQVDAKNVRAINLNDIKNIQYVAGEKGCGSIIISTDASLKLEETKLRKTAMVPIAKEGAGSVSAPFMEVATLVLYNVDAPEKAMGVLNGAAV